MGAYKFTRKPDGEVLAMSRIEAIHAKLPNTHLVMHGSSSVPQELQDMINKYGGKMKQTYGVPVEEIQRGIKSGVRKINVDTDNRMAMTAAIRKVLMESPEKFDPRDYLKPARTAMREICVARMVAFGQAGHGANSANNWASWFSSSLLASQSLKFRLLRHSGQWLTVARAMRGLCPPRLPIRSMVIFTMPGFRFATISWPMAEANNAVVGDCGLDWFHGSQHTIVPCTCILH